MADKGQDKGADKGADLGYVGIDAILEQMRRKAMKQGFELNIMVVGECWFISYNSSYADSSPGFYSNSSYLGTRRADAPHKGVRKENLYWSGEVFWKTEMFM